MSVILSLQGGPHVMITHDALDLTVQSPPSSGPPPPRRQTWDHPPPAIRHGTPSATSGGQHWGLLKTCSVEDPRCDIWWPTSWRPVQTCSVEDPQERHLVANELETCSNLFTWDPPPKQHLVVATKACTVCKRAVRIILSCFNIFVEDIFSYLLNKIALSQYIC